jgi:hypothetical protein
LLQFFYNNANALGSAFGGAEEVYSTRRGIQKSNVWNNCLVIAFIVLALLNLLSKK